MSTSVQSTTTPPLPREIVYDRETHDFACYLNGDLVCFARTYHEGETTLDAVAYEMAGGPPVDIPDEPPDTPPGGPEPPYPWKAPEGYTREEWDRLRFLDTCVRGENVMDWAYIDALTAHVRRSVRDLHPDLGETVRVHPCGTTGVLLAVDSHGPIVVSGTDRHALVWGNVERLEVVW